MIKEIIDEFAKKYTNQDDINKIADLFRSAFTDKGLAEELKALIYSIYGYAKRHNYLRSVQSKKETYSVMVQNAVELLGAMLIDKIK